MCDPAFERCTDAGGRVGFPLDGEDVWLLEAARMEPAPATAADLDWRSWRAPLTPRTRAAEPPPAP